MSAGGATAAETRIGSRARSWWANHLLVARTSLAGLLTTWVASMMTWLVIGIALALPAILYVMIKNAEVVSGDWHGKPRMSLYLEADVDDAAARAFTAELGAQPGIATTRYISPDAALAEFQRRSGFGDVLNSLPDNPLPALVEVGPENTDVSELRILAEALGEDHRVHQVVFDLAWIERLFALLAFAERLVTALSLVLASGVILVIGNTIRLAIENRRAEIEIVKLVGATDAFVRRPFLYLGLWYGTGGALAGGLLVQVSTWFLSYPVEALAQSYRHAFALSGLSIAELLWMFIIGGALGMLGAMLAVGRHLRLIEPS